MTQERIREILAEHEFLRGLSPQQVSAIAEHASLNEYRAGQVLVRESEPADHFFLVQSGRVALELHTPSQGDIRIQTVGAGEPVGWSWLVPPHRWQFDARSIGASQAIAIRGDALRRLCEQDHELGYQLLKRLVGAIAGRLAATRLQVLDIYQ